MYNNSNTNDSKIINQYKKYFISSFSYFISNVIKKYAATFFEHIKTHIKCLLGKTFIISDMITLWENSGGCDNQYKSETGFSLLSSISCVLSYYIYIYTLYILFISYICLCVKNSEQKLSYNLFWYSFEPKINKTERSDISL